MVSDDHKCIFIHIPRTGGTTIERYFGFNYTRGHVEEKHYDACKIATDHSAKWQQYWKFTIVRHPLERLVSYYLFSRGGGGIPAFPGFVLKSMDDYATKPDKMELILRIIFKPQWDMITGRERKNIVVNHLGRFEDYQSELNMLTERFNLFRPKNQINLAPGLKRPQYVDAGYEYQQFYDAGLRNKVYDFYHNDFDKLGYTL